MRKLLVSVALATATLAAVPAAAQYGQNDRHWNDRRDDRRGDFYQRGPSRQAVSQLIRQLNEVDARIDRQMRRGNISRREGIALNRQANQIRNRLARASRNGLSGREFAELRVQVNRLEQNLRLERRDRDGRRF
ncbi:MAG TPA: hypothetical protein VFO69_10075 [Allosphingosinicella sp.]|nr:hypothetical protein [Allosphingosinicella sp.]